MRVILTGWLIAAALICVALAPVVITATHGPAAMAAAQTLAHGHSHGDIDGAGGHDAADHEHQFSAILPPPPDSAPPPGRNLRLIEARAGWMHPADGPLRPPRV